MPYEKELFSSIYVFPLHYHYRSWMMVSNVWMMSSYISREKMTEM